jgi:hypothetical protein
MVTYSLPNNTRSFAWVDEWWIIVHTSNFFEKGAATRRKGRTDNHVVGRLWCPLFAAKVGVVFSQLCYEICKISCYTSRQRQRMISYLISISSSSWKFYHLVVFCTCILPFPVEFPELPSGRRRRRIFFTATKSAEYPKLPKLLVPT